MRMFLLNFNLQKFQKAQYSWNFGYLIIIEALEDDVDYPRKTNQNSACHTLSNIHRILPGHPILLCDFPLLGGIPTIWSSAAAVSPRLFAQYSKLGLKLSCPPCSKNPLIEEWIRVGEGVVIIPLECCKNNMTYANKIAVIFLFLHAPVEKNFFRLYWRNRTCGWTKSTSFCNKLCKR